MRALENSEVPPTPVAVAVTRQLTGTAVAKSNEKGALPLALVVTLLWPMKVLPSLKPEGSGAGLEKNWMVKVLLGVELRAPVMVVGPPEAVTAEEMPGKFWRVFASVSGSSGSLGVTPSAIPRSMPNPPLL